jgi:hypothetical protein
VPPARSRTADGAGLAGGLREWGGPAAKAESGGPSGAPDRIPGTIASREFFTLSLISFLHRAQLLLRD